MRGAVRREGALVFRRMMPALAGWLSLVVGGSAGAATLLETSELLASTPEAAAQLPPAYEFTLTAAADYTVTLEDISRNLGTPQARLQSLEVLVIRDLQPVTKFEIEYPAQPDGTIPRATRNFAGTPGTYRVHVLGQIPTDGAGGAFSVKVTPTAGGVAVLERAGSVAANGGPNTNQSSLQTEFTVAAAGTYELNLADRVFPAQLTRAQIVLLRWNGNTPEEALRTDVTTPVSFTGSFAATAANQRFEMIVIATAAETEQAGLYGLKIRDPSSTVIYGSENIVGRLAPARTIPVPATDGYMLSVADLGFPDVMTSVSAAIVQTGDLKGSLVNGGAVRVELTQGEAQLYVFNVTPDIGVMSTTLTRNDQVAWSDIHLVDASPDPATPSIYSFTPSQPVGTGAYTLTVSDFRFPSPLTSVATAVVQQAEIVDSTDELGAKTVSLQSGPVRVLVAVTPPPAVGGMPGNGMFALTLSTQPGNATVFDSTQGVGGLFNSRTLNVPVAGRYDVILRDFEFPERLRTSWLVITRGTTEIGQVIGSSTIQLQLEAGAHVLNFLGQPAANALYGAYGMKVADSTPPPVVTLSASPTAVTSGQTTTLTWSATNATTCTASGAWSGTKSASGNQASGALTSNSTFEIECVGPGGRASASAAVTVNAPAPKSGGGGSVNLLLLLSLASMAGARMIRRERTG
jgi:hypothetical protein